jgi:hypothetical protein
MILVGGQLTQVGLICKFIFFLSYHVMMKLCKMVSKERLMIDCMLLLVEFSILACLVFFCFFCFLIECISTNPCLAVVDQNSSFSFINAF